MDKLDKRIIKKRIVISYCIRMIKLEKKDREYWRWLYKNQIESLEQILNKKEIKKFEEASQ